MVQRFTFDDVAALYDATRPDYPRALFDDIAAFAGLKPGDKILELGCGSGQATKDFVARGYRIVALDPGSELIEIARHKFAAASNVEFVASTFEAWPAEQAAYKLVPRRKSWYWIAPDIRFAKAADALVPGGAACRLRQRPDRRQFADPRGVTSNLRPSRARIYRRTARGLVHAGGAGCGAVRAIRTVQAGVAPQLRVVEDPFHFRLRPTSGARCRTSRCSRATNATPCSTRSQKPSTRRAGNANSTMRRIFI